MLVSLMTLIGILSGFFQLYIENYRKQVTDKINGVIIEYLRKAIKDVSLDDLIKICRSEQKYSELISRIGKIITDQDKGNNKNNPTLKSIMTVQLSLNEDVHALFHFLEAYAELAQEKSLNRQKLNDMYEFYFKEKFAQYKKEFDDEDFSEVSDTVFASIIFFDEILANIVNANFQLASGDETLNSFESYHRNFGQECVFYALDRILHTSKENQPIKK